MGKQVTKFFERLLERSENCNITAKELKEAILQCNFQEEVEKNILNKIDCHKCNGHESKDRSLFSIAYYDQVSWIQCGLCKEIIIDSLEISFYTLCKGESKENIG